MKNYQKYINVAQSYLDNIGSDYKIQSDSCNKSLSIIGNKHDFIVETNEQQDDKKITCTINVSDTTGVMIYIKNIQPDSDSTINSKLVSEMFSKIEYDEQSKKIFFSTKNVYSKKTNIKNQDSESCSLYETVSITLKHNNFKYSDGIDNNLIESKELIK